MILRQFTNNEFISTSNTSSGFLINWPGTELVLFLLIWFAFVLSLVLALVGALSYLRPKPGGLPGSLLLFLIFSCAFVLAGRLLFSPMSDGPGEGDRFFLRERFWLLERLDLHLSLLELVPEFISVSTSSSVSESVIFWSSSRFRE